jgi:hypothetical protein
MRIGDHIELPELSSPPGTPASNKVTVYAKSDGLVYAKDDTGAETPLGGGSGGTSNLILLYSNESDTSETTTSTAETAALRSYTLPANSYDYILIEATVRNRVEQDQSARCDFTWRIKEAGSTVYTAIERVIALSTSGVNSGGRNETRVSTIIAGGQGADTALTVTGQMSLSNAATGIMVRSFRVWGITADAAVTAPKVVTSYLESDVRASTTTLTATTLSVAVKAGHTYHIRLSFVAYNVSETQNLKWRMQYTGTQTSYIVRGTRAPVSTNVYSWGSYVHNVYADQILTVGHRYVPIEFEFITQATTDGTWTLEMAQNASSGTDQYIRQATLIATRLT